VLVIPGFMASRVCGSHYAKTAACEVEREQRGFETESGNHETTKRIMAPACNSWLHGFQINPPVLLVFGGRSIYGSLAGTAIDNEDTLAFSVLENIRPMIEAVPLEQAADGYARMMQGKARFRMVLVVKEAVAPAAPLTRQR
jgi:D-arabinose 1-dehydrogenase-like Zn-dependent alcohol dehydrogenase